LLGRLGWVLNLHIRSTRTPGDDPAAEGAPVRPGPASAPPGKRVKRSKAKSYDPWAVPDAAEQEPDPGLPRHLKPGDVYGVQKKGKAPPRPAEPPKPRRRVYDDDDDTPYAVKPEPAAPKAGSPRADVTEVSEYELRLAQ